MKKNLLIPAINEWQMPPDRENENPSGVIFACNEARFTSANYSEALTSYTVGWRDPNDLDAMLQRLFPEVPVARRFEWKKSVNAEAFLSETDDVRAIGSAFKFVEYKGESVTDKTYNKGLGIRIDHDDTLDDMYEQTATNRLLQRLARNELRRGLAALVAAATANTSVWNKLTNPDKDLRDRLRIAKDASGIRPNVLLFSDDAWDLRQDAYEQQNTPAGYRAADMDPAALALKLRVRLVEIINAVYQSTLTAKAKVQTGLTTLSYYADPGAGKDDPSNVKRFITPTGAGRYKVYVTPHEKYTDIMVEHYSNIVITSTLGIDQLTVRAAD